MDDQIPGSGAPGPAHPPEPSRDESSGLSFPVVGVGASAGGLAALAKFLESLPAEPGMAFVVILHLSPKHESSAAAILQRSTRMLVTQVTGKAPIEANHVYVIPPATGLSMYDGHLSLTKPEREDGRQVVIDLFFRTLAKAHKERSIAIVLSGTGADGAVGIGEVKEGGGLVIAQSPLDAEYDGMPSSAIATGRVDLVLPVAEMGQKLLDIWRNAQLIQLPNAAGSGLRSEPPNATGSAELALRNIMTMLQVRTGHDFKHYKRATVLRRIERRLQINGIAHLPAYETFLQEQPTETRLLLSDMLIGVTNFFRDRDAFEALERSVIPELVAEAPLNEPLRVWVPGCSTGEEAYSLAMLLSEQAQGGSARPIQVFASDIDEQALAKGREGTYPQSIETDIPPRMVKRFFSHVGANYRVVKPLRERVLFALHNILRDPPFARLDMVSCRNLLIYLDRDVQKDILQMFHFALRPGGYLFLGNSETADAAGQLFLPADKKHRIYRASMMLHSARAMPRLPLGGVEHRAARAPPALPPRASLSIAGTHQQLLEEHAPPSLLITAEGEILHSSRAEPYLRFAPGVPSQQVLAVIDPALRPALRTAIYQANQGGDVINSPGALFARDDGLTSVNITVKRVQSDDQQQQLLLVLFDETPQAPPADEAVASAGDKDPVMHRLEAELQHKDGQLQRTIAQYETSVEELKASNEELQAINEELRSATEELETSKEELQSTNEELVTVNHELKSKVEETIEINDDLQNLIASTDIATVFVDSEMRIKRFTPAATRIFNIIGNDVGRSLMDITHRLDYDGLAEDAAAAFNSLQAIEREVASHDGRWFLARLLPYRTVADRIDGAVLNFVDISRQRSAERRVDIERERMQLISASMPDFAIVTLDEAGRFTSWSTGAEALFGYREDEIIGQPFELLFVAEDREAGAPGDEMRRAREAGRASDERWHLRKDGTRIFTSGIMSPMQLSDSKGFAKIARDMSAREQTDASRSAALASAVASANSAVVASHQKDEFLAIMSHELKNPLNLIQVNTQLLLALPQAQQIPAVMRIGETIQRSVRGQARIIDDLLDVSRVRAGKLMLDSQLLDLREALQPAIAWAQAQAQQTGVAFSADVTTETLLVKGDAVRFEQIAMNLLGNAFKFTASGGHVALRLQQDGAEALLAVVDNGQGIEPDFLPHVFELFKQSPAGAARATSGMGIGLSLVRDLVLMQSGRIEAKSAGAGAGSAFIVHLPLLTRAGADEAMEAEGYGGGSELIGLHILCVDDSADTLETFGMLLETTGAVVFPASSAAKALALAKSNRIDLIISDIGMPGMDGNALIQTLRRLPTTANVPAVALSGYGRAEDVQAALQAGFSAHLDKPVDLEQLQQLITMLKPRAAGRRTE